MASPGALDAALRPFLAAALGRLLGGPDADLEAFVLAGLSRLPRCPPASTAAQPLLAELSDVLGAPEAAELLRGAWAAAAAAAAAAAGASAAAGRR